VKQGLSSCVSLGMRRFLRLKSCDVDSQGGNSYTLRAGRFCRSFRAGQFLILSQGSATLHPGLRSLATPWLGSFAKARLKHSHRDATGYSRTCFGHRCSLPQKGPVTNFCVAVTGSFRVLYIFVIIEHASRRLLHWNVTSNPTAAWTLQQLLRGDRL
jgi:hypothetical protein